MYIYIYIYTLKRNNNIIIMIINNIIIIVDLRPGDAAPVGLLAGLAHAAAVQAVDLVVRQLEDLFVLLLCLCFIGSTCFVFYRL